MMGSLFGFVITPAPIRDIPGARVRGADEDLRPAAANVAELLVSLWIHLGEPRLCDTDKPYKPVLEFSVFDNTFKIFY